MKYLRYRYEETVSYGRLEGDTVREIRGGLFGEREEKGIARNLNAVQLLCPCEPTKILAVGLNYRSHLGERAEPREPAIFVMPPSALLEAGGAIRIPAGSMDLHYEGELVAVIGETVRHATPEAAEACIFGFTCGNDVSERNWQKNDLQWWRAKGCDTFAPLGPWIVPDFDWARGGIKTHLNGKVVQEGRFRELLFDPPSIVSYISRHMTLFPGDVVYTGTPGHTHALKPGDVLEVEIDGIGTLSNTVA